eukprot:sb/3472787/
MKTGLQSKLNYRWTPIYRAPIYRNPDLPGGFLSPDFFPARVKAEGLHPDAFCICGSLGLMGITYRFVRVSNRLISGRTRDKMHRLETLFERGCIQLEVSLYRILDKSRICGSDICPTPIYRAPQFTGQNGFPRESRVNRGPTANIRPSCLTQLPLKFLILD